MPTLYCGPWLAKIRRGGPVNRNIFSQSYTIGGCYMEIGNFQFSVAYL